MRGYTRSEKRTLLGLSVYVTQRDLFEASTLTLSGGTYYAGGTFDGDATSNVYFSAGVLDIQVDNPFPGTEDFIHRGLFSFTGGKIKVKQNKRVKFQ